MTCRKRLPPPAVPRPRDVGHGLELHVYCPSCYTSRIVTTDDPRWLDRSLAAARFRCTGWRPATGQPCKGRGVPKIRPHDLLPVGGAVTLAFLWCPRCLWEIDQAQLDKPPWSGRRSTIAAIIFSSGTAIHSLRR